MNTKLKSRNSRIDRINNLITNSKQIKRKSEFLKSKFPNFSKTFRNNNFNIYKRSKNIEKVYKNKSLNFQKSSSELCDELLKKNIKECKKVSNRFGTKSAFSNKKIKSLNLSKSKKKKKLQSPFIKTSFKKSYLSNRHFETNLIKKSSIRKIFIKNISKTDNNFHKNQIQKKIVEKTSKNLSNKKKKKFKDLNDSKSESNNFDYKQNLNQSENSNFTNFIGPEQKNKMLDFLNELKNLLKYEDELKIKTEEIVLEIKKENIYLEKKINLHSCKNLVFFFKRKYKKIFKKFFKKIKL